jgi:II/X family phage/plasmid replication protein
MYDTIEVISPALEDSVVKAVVKKSQVLERYDCETGEILFRITTGFLEGSYDSRLSIRQVEGNKIRISGSVHKFILGHNCFGGPVDIKKCCKYLVLVVQKRLNIELPGWDKWEVGRVDIAHVFNLGDYQTVCDYLRSLRTAVYPRRKVQTYDLESVYFPGSSTTLKFYNKGIEFSTHDKPRLVRLKDGNIYTEENIDLLEKLSLQLIRVEVEVRRRKMKNDGVKLNCGSLDDGYFNACYEKEVLKVIKEGNSDLELVRDIEGVKDRLNRFYSKRKADSLFGTWSRIQLEGIDVVKNTYGRTQWYCIRRDFAYCGISLKGSLEIVDVINRSLPAQNVSRIYSFIPLPGERYHVSGRFLDIDDAIAQLELVS